MGTLNTDADGAQADGLAQLREMMGTEAPEAEPGDVEDAPDFDDWLATKEEGTDEDTSDDSDGDEEDEADDDLVEDEELSDEEAGDEDDETDEDSEEVEEQKAVVETNTRLVKKINNVSKENVRLKRELSELKKTGNVTDPMKSFWDDYEYDPVSAIKSLVSSKHGDQIDDKMQDLAQEFVYVLTGLDDNPDLDPSLAMDRKMKKFEQGLRKKERQLDEQIRKQKEQEELQSSKASQKQAISAVDTWLGAQNDAYPFLSMKSDAATQVINELQLQQDNGLVIGDDDHAAEVLGQIAAAYNTYYRSEAEKVAEVLERTGSKKKRKKVVGSKKTLTNKKASGSSAKKRKTKTKQSVGDLSPDEFLAMKFGE